MAKLRKRGYRIKPATMKVDPLNYVFKTVYKELPQFKKTEVEKEKRNTGITVRGSWPLIGRQVYDWELDFDKKRNNDVIVKVNLWGKRGTNVGETYIASVAIIDKLSKKISKWVAENIDIIKEREGK